MRFLLPALVLSAAISSFGQSAPQRSIDPDQIFQMPKQFQRGFGDFRKPPTFRAPLQIVPPAVVLRQKPRLESRDMDKGMIHRPRRDTFAMQQPRIPQASALYPDLKLLPLGKQPGE